MWRNNVYTKVFFLSELRFVRSMPTVRPDTPGGHASPFLAARAPFLKAGTIEIGSPNLSSAVSRSVRSFSNSEAQDADEVGPDNRNVSLTLSFWKIKNLWETSCFGEVQATGASKGWALKSASMLRRNNRALAGHVQQPLSPNQVKQAESMRKTSLLDNKHFT